MSCVLRKTGILGVAGVLLASSPLAAEPRLTITPTGPVETVFDWSEDACDKSHVPDAPARAFKRTDGEAVMIASHNDNRAFTGKSLSALRPKCDIIFEAAHSADLGKYDDLAWISALYTRDGQTVHALSHTELRGERTPGQCPKGKYSACLFNTVTALVSRDGGRSFKAEGVSPPVVAALPYAFPTDRDARVGYANPTNIIERGGWYYTMVFADGYRAQKRGACLLRTKDLDDPSSWRAWDGEGFNARFVDPFRAAPAEAGGHVCAPVGKGVIGRMVGGITTHRPSGKVVAVFGDKHKVDGRAVSGIYTSFSDNLVDWSKPKLVYESPLLWQKTCGRTSVFYPALLDEDAVTASFEDMDGTAFLYMTRYQPEGCRVTWDRDLVRLPVGVTFTP